jgi:hypothetical protein
MDKNYLRNKEIHLKRYERPLTVSEKPFVIIKKRKKKYGNLDRVQGHALRLVNGECPGQA